MATRKRGEGPVNISSAVNDDSIKKSEDLARAVAKLRNENVKLSRTMDRELKASLVNYNLQLNKMEKAQLNYIKNIDSLTKAERAKFRLNQIMTNELRTQIRDLEKLSDGNKNANKSGTAFLQSMQTRFPRVTALASALATGIGVGLTGALGLATEAAGFLFRQVQNIYNVWFTLQAQAVRGMGELAQVTAANASDLENMANIAEGMQGTFRELGGAVGGVEESFAFMREFSPVLRDTRMQTAEMAGNMLEVTRVFGLSAQQGIDLFRDLSLGVFGTNQSLDEFSVDMIDFASSIHMNAATLMQDFAGARAEIARFGRDGISAFRNAAAMAQQFGFETRTILDMARQFNTFGQASDSVNQLNAMLGTTISSFDLMMEQDPAARVEILRQQIQDAGTSWADMDQYQRSAIATSLGQTEEVAGRLFMEQTTLAEIQQQQQEAAREEEARNAMRQSDEMVMHDMLMQTSTLFRSIGDRITEIQAIVGEALSPAFEAFHDEIDDLARDFSNWLEEAQRTGELQEIIDGIGDGVRLIGAGIRGINETSDTLSRYWEGLAVSVETVTTGIQNAYSFITDPIGGMAEREQRTAHLTERAGALSSRTLAEQGQSSIDQTASTLTGQGASSFAQLVDSFISSHPNMAPEQAASVLQNRIGPEATAQLERQYSTSLENFVSRHYDRFRRGEEMAVAPTVTEQTSEVESASDSTISSAPEMSATSTAPSTDRTVSSPRSAPTTISIAPIVAVGRVQLDSQDVGRVFVDISSRA